MDQSKDWIARYGIMLGKRYTDYQRKKFLRATQTELSKMNYDTDITLSTVSYLKTEKKNFYNLYAGDLKRANVVISTYYDTSVKSFGAYAQTAFETNLPKKSAFVNLIIPLLIFIVTGIFSYFVMLPIVSQSGWLSVWTFLYLLIVLAALFMITRTRSGVLNRWNMIRNTSSILAIFHLASSIPKADRKRIAFAFVDGGANSGFGHKMMRDYFKSSGAMFVTLDSIGNPGDFQWFTDKNIQVDSGDQVHGLPKRWSEFGDVLLTAGTLENKNILIHNANTRKDKELDEKKISGCVERLKGIVKQLR